MAPTLASRRSAGIVLPIGFDMPSPDAVLAGVSAIANEWRSVAMAWHVLLAALMAAFVAGWRPSSRRLGWLLCPPFASVSAMAWLAGNPFNGLMFALLAVLLAALARRLPRAPIRLAPSSFVVTGSLLVAFGWTYPHFLRTESWSDYLFAAPFGLIPCPTLAVTIGVTLLFDELRRSRWAVVVSAAGVAYGVIGVVWLGVVLDVGLLVGAVILGVTATTRVRGNSAGASVAARRPGSAAL